MHRWPTDGGGWSRRRQRRDQHRSPWWRPHPYERANPLSRQQICELTHITGELGGGRGHPAGPDSVDRHPGANPAVALLSDQHRIVTHHHRHGHLAGDLGERMSEPLFLADQQRHSTCRGETGTHHHQPHHPPGDQTAPTRDNADRATCSGTDRDGRQHRDRGEQTGDRDRPYHHRRDQQPQIHPGSHGHQIAQLGQACRADPVDLTELVHRGEPTVAGAPVDDRARRHRPHTRQCIELILGGRIQIDAAS